MTRQVEIPTYKPIIPNVVWGRKGPQLNGPNGIEDTTQILCVERFQESNDEQVIKFIRKCAGEYQSGGYDRTRGIYTIIGTLFNSDGINNIANGEPGITSLIAQKVAGTDRASGETYLVTHGGSVFDGAMNLYGTAAANAGFPGYEELIHKTSPDEWVFRFGLEGSHSLPPRSKIERILASGEYDPALVFFMHNGSKAKLAGEVEFLYSALEHKIQRIEDTTESLLEKRAFATMKRFGEAVVEIQSAKAKEEKNKEILKELIKQAIEESKKDEKPKFRRGGNLNEN